MCCASLDPASRELFSYLNKDFYLLPFSLFVLTHFLNYEYPIAMAKNK